MPDSNNVFYYLHTRKPLISEWFLFHPKNLLPFHDHWKIIKTKTNTNEDTIFWRYQMANSTEASNRSFYPIFKKRFVHLQTLLTIHKPKKVLSDGSLRGPLVRSSQSKSPKGPSYYSKSIMLQFQISYHRHLNVW